MSRAVASFVGLRDRTPQDYIPNAPDDRNDHVRYMAAEPLRELASLFLVDRERPPLSPEQMQQSATEQIGYAIVSRPDFSTVLLAFGHTRKCSVAWQTESAKSTAFW